MPDGYPSTTMTTWQELEALALAGTHEYLREMILPSLPVGRALDLGAGSGRFSLILKEAGYDVLAVEQNRARFIADVPLREDVDLNHGNFADRLPGPFDLVVAIEVLEHLENPISFLRSVRTLLGPTGAALITTPNVDSLAARLRFAFSGTIRSFNDAGEATHITPVFYDLCVRRWMPQAGLRLTSYRTYPEHGYRAVPSWTTYLWTLMTYLIHGRGLAGDTSIFVMQSGQRIMPVFGTSGRSTA